MEKFVPIFAAFPRFASSPAWKVGLTNLATNAELKMADLLCTALLLDGAS
jgi:hypothetical protein